MAQNHEPAPSEVERLRRVVQTIHDHYAPYGHERYPEHNQHLDRVFGMDTEAEEAFWFAEARWALGLSTVST